MWILTSELNEYDQYGEYFIAAWLQKPGISQLQKVLNVWAPSYVEHVYNGGGRLKDDYLWHHLFEYHED